MKALFLIAVGFFVGWAVTSRQIVGPLGMTEDPPNNGASPVTYETAGITDGGT